MSSEMRELIAKWRHSANEPADGSLKTDYDFAMEDCANDLETLLARTEAGADGRIDHHKAMQALEDLDDCARMDVGIAATGPYDLLRRYIMQQNRTHPQDASGDAERAKKYEELIYAVGNKYPGETRHETALRYIRQAESHVGSEGCAAMQAKEAK